MNKKSLVSIICLCYNHEKYVVECLESIINQSHQPLEIFIVDDFSTDKSVEVIEKWLENYPEIIFFKNSSNIGNTKTFNSILSKTTGDYVLDLAADDVLMPNFFELLIAKFNSTNYLNLGAVFGNCILIDEKGLTLNTFFETTKAGKIINYPKTGDVYSEIIKGGKESMCTVSTLFKKEVFEVLNGYDNTLAYEDLDFWIRASRIYNFDFIEDCIVKKRVLSKSLGSQFHKNNNLQSKKLNQSTLIIIKKAIALNRDVNEDKAILKRIHYEFLSNIKIYQIQYVFVYFCLIIQIRLRVLFSSQGV